MGILCSLIVLMILQTHGSLGLDLFEIGKEYKYQYLGLFTTGTEEPVSHASTYRIKADLRIQGTSPNTLTLRMEDVLFGIYNGKWSYFPTPSFDLFTDDRFKAFEEPFQIILTEEGKFKTLIMNDQEPEYASNLKRGLATYLQLNLSTGFDSVQIFKDLELTTMGECTTAFEIFPKSPITGSVRVGKFRNHADCPDIPTRTRNGNKAYYKCSNDNTRDVLNSTAYAVYDISLSESEEKAISLNSLTVLSSILYWPFTSKGQFLYTWYNLTLSLEKVLPISSPIGSPENAESHEDLSFVFEQSDYSDPEEELPDLKFPEPFFYHQTSSESEPESFVAASTLAEETISAVADSLINPNVFEDVKKFHESSPLKISALLSTLDYDSLKLLYAKYSEGVVGAGMDKNNRKVTELNLYIDGLILTGSSASALVLKDILLRATPTDYELFARILPTFPHYIRNPSEPLAKELDPIFELLKKGGISSDLKQMIESSISTLISKCCEKNNCSSSQLLDKYVTYFETKLSQSKDFTEATSAILGLRNLRIGSSLNKVLEIALGNVKQFPGNESSIRVQSIWSLGHLLYSSEGSQVRRSLLQTFFNRKESCEIRTSIFGLLMGASPDKRTLHEIAYFMWSESCPQTMNIVRSTLINMAKSKSPCNPIGSYAQTILKYLPPGAVDPTRTTSHLIDYLDEATGFGRSTYLTIQKSGKSALPLSIYLGSSDNIAGYSSSQFGIFIRLQGLEKFLSQLKLTSGEILDGAPILNFLNKLRISKVKPTPLKLELTILYSDRVVLYYAGDASTLPSIIAKTMSKIKVNWERSWLVGEMIHQQPLEVGIPTSIYASGLINQQININAKFKDFKAGSKSFSMDLDGQTQLNIFAKTVISNHIPVLGTMHSAGLSRVLRFRIPRRDSSITLNLDKKPNWMLTTSPPEEDKPTILQTHAAAITFVRNEQPIHKEYLELLGKSCPDCVELSLVSKGPPASKSGVLLPLPSFLKGVQGGLKLFNCERDNLKSRAISKFKELFGDTGKYSGIFGTPTGKIILGFQAAQFYFFFWPNPEPCGFTLFIAKNSNTSSKILEKADNSISVEFGLDPSSPYFGQFTLDYSLNLNYLEGGSSQTKTTTEYQLQISPATQGQQTMTLKGSLTGTAIEYNRIFCLDINNSLSLPSNDPLGFENENEPSIRQTFQLKIDKLPKRDPSKHCMGNQVDITIQATAGRSLEQKAEAANLQPTSLPYLYCLLQRSSGVWPTNLIPPTRECKQVVADQTNLQSVNLTLNYKIREEVINRWGFKWPLKFISNLLSFYEDDEPYPNDKPTVPELDYLSGQIEIETNRNENNPKMNLHYKDHSSSSSSSFQQNFKDIDLNLIPSVLQLDPVPSRFTHLSQFLFNNGFIGSCAITPSQIVTYDNFQYAVNLTECDSLLSADCGEAPVSKFAITAKRISNSKLSVRILLGSDQIELSNGNVLINSNTITFDSNGIHKHGDLGRILLIKEGRDINLKSFSSGIELRYADGDFLDITTASQYRGITCGLCGNFDTSSYNDLIGPKSPQCPINSMVDAWSDPKSCSRSNLLNQC